MDLSGRAPCGDSDARTLGNLNSHYLLLQDYIKNQNKFWTALYTQKGVSPSRKTQLKMFSGVCGAAVESIWCYLEENFENHKLQETMKKSMVMMLGDSFGLNGMLMERMI